MDNRIIDIHTHILPGVDDGAKNIDESVKIINYLFDNGITDIVFTSHYIKNSKYNYNQISRERILRILREKVNNNINLYLGNEVYLTDDIIRLLEEHEISVINNSKYLLIELPLNSYIESLQNILCDLNNYGIVPIIAHPERYDFLQKNNKRVCELLEFGCLLQCNIDSLIGKYGRKAKKTMKYLLKNDLVSFVATDTHAVGNSKQLQKAYKKLKKIVGKEKFKELTYINPSRVLKNKQINGNLEYLMKQENRIR